MLQLICYSIVIYTCGVWLARTKEKWYFPDGNHDIGEILKIINLPLILKYLFELISFLIILLKCDLDCEWKIRKGSVPFISNIWPPENKNRDCNITTWGWLFPNLNILGSQHSNEIIDKNNHIILK